MSSKRGPDALAYDDSADLVNAVIGALQAPTERTNVADAYANDKNLATEIQAYAKIAGRDWTFYVKLLAIQIGRNTDANPGATPTDIDLGPAKVVSRQHASISYNLETRRWELKVLGRNGARVDGNKVAVGPQHLAPLHSGAILEVGGTQMMFILPELPPQIAPKMAAKCLSRTEKRPAALKSFQIYDKLQLAQLPSSVSATLLQSNLDQDLSKEEAKDIKPPYSYATMITQAILLNEDGVMSLLEIYAWIALHYAYYKFLKTGWQNLIRHNLSLNKAFEKVPRRPNEPGKGMKWQISDAYKEEFLSKINNGGLSKNRRGSSVLRQLHLHLATHKHLPESKRTENSIELQLHHNQQKQIYELSAKRQPSPSQRQYENDPRNSKDSQKLMYDQKIYDQLPHPPHPQQPPYEYPYPYAMPDMQFLPKLNQPYRYPYYKPESPHQETPKLPKVNGTLFNLPPPGHSRLSSYVQDLQNFETTTAPTSLELQLGFTLPKKIAALEAFTPERGAKAAKLMPMGNQLLPAFWNFVQFSTPNGQTPRKGSDGSQGSPTLRKVKEERA